MSGPGTADPDVAEPLLAPRFSLPRRDYPWLTLILLGMNLAFALAQIQLGGMERGATLVFLGAKVNSLVQSGEFWRVVTANFLHMGWAHLVPNMVFLLFVGALVEVLYGHTRFLIFYVLSGTAGMLVNYEVAPGLAVGASAAVFGLLGVVVVHDFKYRARVSPLLLTRIGILPMLIVMLILFGMSDPRVHTWGHVGGLLTGMVLAMLTESRVTGGNRLDREALPLPAALGTAVALLLYGFGGLALNVERQMPLLHAGRAAARKDDVQAVRHYQESLQRQPRLQEIRIELMAALLRQKRWDEAREQYLEFLRQTPAKERNEGTYLLMLRQAAQEFGNAGRYVEAEEALREALRLAPDARSRAELENALAWTLADKLNRNYDEALKLAESATAVEQNGAYLDTLAWVYYRLGRYPEALKVQQQAVQKTSDDPEILYHLAVILETHGKKDEAVKQYAAAIKQQEKRKDADARAAVLRSREALKRLTGTDRLEETPRGRV